MRINHNVSAMNTYRQYNSNTQKTNKAMEKLSSGLRINRAADDAAGLSISEKMRANIRAINQKIRNTQDNISYIQTAEGALDEVSSMLVRMKELLVQRDNVTYGDEEKDNINLELAALAQSINDIIGEDEETGTLFNGKNALIDVVNHDDFDDFVFEAADPDDGVVADDVEALDVDAIDEKISFINTRRAEYGAAQNKLEHTINNLSTTAENLQAAESRIRDVDMAEEMMEFTKNNILIQASQSMLAQANQQPQGILQLLRG